MEKEDIICNPSTNLLGTLSYSGYSISSAIADIIDNSISADATKVVVNFSYDLDNPFISITDNGFGMDYNDLIKCAQLACKSIDEKRSEHDLGRFGLGLKSSASYLGNKLYVYSKTNKDVENGFLMDMNVIKNEGKWIYSFFRRTNKIESCSGTMVLIDNLNIFDNFDFETKKRDNVFYSIAEKVSKNLGIIFNLKIKQGLKIILNGHEIVGWDPFFTDKSTILRSEEISYKDSVIKCTSYLLPTFDGLSREEQSLVFGRGLIDQQGFYVYRNDRLIVNGGWLDLPNLTRDAKCNYARIKLEIPNTLDEDFELNFIKNQAKVPDALAGKLLSIAIESRTKSRKSFSYIKNPYKTRVYNKEIKVWNILYKNGNYSLEINTKHPVISKIIGELSKEDANRLLKLLTNDIPIKELSSGKFDLQRFSKEEFSELFMNSYIEQKGYGLSDDEIFKKIMQSEPFCLDFYADYVEELIEGIKNNDK